MKVDRQLTSVAQQIIIDHIQNRKGLIAVDATVGNGNDTLFLAKLAREDGFVYGFDVQEAAIKTTKKKLDEKGLDEKVHLIHDSHENIDRYITSKIDIGMFNLGYLPCGNKNIITNTNSTIQAIEKMVSRLNLNAMVTIICYPGHAGGDDEAGEVCNLLQGYSPKQYTIAKFDIVNTRGFSPILYIIVKIL